MKIMRTIRLALKNIRSNKLRSALTMLGLIIGISSVIVLVGIGTGATTNITSEVASLGTDILTVSVNTDQGLTLDEVSELSELSGIKQAAPFANVSATVSKGASTGSMLSVLGVDGNYLDVRNYTLSAGREISFIDLDNQSKVCIIGADVSQDLFNNENPVDQTIKIGGDNYTVIGTLTEQGSSMGTNADSMVLMPVTTAQSLAGSGDIKSLYVQTENEDAVNFTQLATENYLKTTLDASSDEISVTTQQSMLDTMSSVQDTLILLLAGIASISLLVGGIGVMNVMLVSVTERTKEIGIRKSLGARKSNILVQFLIEALILCLLGGITGILLGLGVGSAAELLGYTFTYSLNIVGIAFGFAAVIGLVFGIFPAYRASCLNPIEALRMD
ncbi:ABC transporter permease [Desulfosporosinus hippei]|uniref:Putative ABC transport system permease protein n=1 Tax=Desulfosporosinus hippei DSM 8344 TaxID=1121419 RepID=A0A1G8JV64_9FIRM|nr:ABC transporter permease [Desulfosporosinus hippei]SDI34490.1 putative ABC transport system permease protein [Desulfosporosinus hippei DSM 8344]